MPIATDKYVFRLPDFGIDSTLGSTLLLNNFMLPLDRPPSVESMPKSEDEYVFVGGNGHCPASVLHIGKYYAPHVGGGGDACEALSLPSEFTNEGGGSGGERRARDSDGGAGRGQNYAGGMLWNGSFAAHLSVITVEFGRAQRVDRSYAVAKSVAAQAYLMSGIKGKLVLTHQADTMGRRALRKFVDPIVRRLMKRAAADHRHIQWVSEGSDELGDFHDKCHVVPMGIEVEAFRRKGRKKVRKIHEKYGHD